MSKDKDEDKIKDALKKDAMSKGPIKGGKGPLEKILGKANKDKGKDGKKK